MEPLLPERPTDTVGVRCDAQVTSLIESLEAQQLRPPGNPGKDTRIAAFSTATLQRLQDPGFRELIYEVSAVRPEFGADFAASLLLRSMQRQLLYNDHGLHYPVPFTSPVVWHQGYDAVLNDPVAVETLQFDLMFRTVQSNVRQRYASIKMLAGLFADRLGDRPRILDVGCSRNHGLKSLGSQALFNTVRVLEPSGPRGGLHKDKEMTQGLNRYLRQPLTIGNSLGLDIWQIRDEGQRQFVRANSFYPSELLDPARVAVYDELDATEVENVDFMQADFSEPMPYDMQDGGPVPQNYDIISIMTVLYQLSPDQQSQVLQNALQRLNPDGLLIIQDVAVADGAQHNHLSIANSFYQGKYTYRTFIYDPRQSDQGFQEIFRWRNGRCLDLQFGAGSVALRGLKLTG